MQEIFQCPVCSADDWSTVETFVYDIRDHHPGGRWYDNEYVQLRRRILFDIWLPRCAHVEVTSRYCDRCGFMCYGPRPDASDARAKYAFLSKTEVHIGGQCDTSDEALLLDRKRAMRVYGAIRKTTSLAKKTILDVGGGNGKLMYPFLQAQCRCYVVDYNAHPIPGVERLGNTVGDISEEMRFDVLICSHVLEHVAEPVGFLTDLWPFLKPGGKAYFEVPLEIWHNIPIDAEPVTHINFFTGHSFTNALHQARFRVVRHACGLGSYDRRRLQIVWAVAERASSDDHFELLPRSSDATRRLINPSPWTIIRKVLFVDLRIERSLNPVFRLITRMLNRAVRMLGSTADSRGST